MITKIQNNEDGIAHLVPVLILLVVVAVGGVGYRVYSQTSKPNASITSTQKADDAALLNADLSTIKSLSDIQTQAEGQLNGATISGVELESEEGILVYKLALTDGRVLKFNALTGESAGTSNKNDKETQNSVPLAIAADLIGFAKAREVASAERPGKSVSKIELETENGVLVYSVRFTDDGRVDVNAKTAEIVRTKSGENKTESTENRSDDSADSGSNTNSGSSGGGSGSSNSGRSSSTSDSSDDSDDNDSSPSTSTPSPSATASSGGISESQAKTIANNRLPGRTIEKVESDTEDGAAVFSVRYTDDGRVDVRKSDGSIVRVKE